MQKPLQIPEESLGKLVPHYGMIFFGVFQFCVYLVGIMTNIIIEACDPDGTYWLPWAIVIACVEIIFSIGIIGSAYIRNFVLFFIFALLWSLAIVAAVLISIAFRPDCQQNHYQAILEVGLLILVGCSSPWILAYEAITMVRDRNRQRKSWEGHMTDMLLKSEVLEFLSDDNLPAENEVTTFEAALTWMSAGDSSRRSLLVPLMGCVRFGLMDQQGFEYIAQSQLIDTTSAKLDFELQRDPTAKSSLAVMADAVEELMDTSGKSRTPPPLSPRAGTPQQGGASSILRHPADASMSFSDPNAPRVMTPRLLKTGWQEENGSFRPIASPWGEGSEVYRCASDEESGGYEYGQGPALA
ncbi:hypothetical protein GUITHDRAFT_139498 [Guillardia theta CCMP2712]|uniref:BACK domain-containing protein n=1 Tax=Guillardia theta (strain CCMP2712) TaxID=905079 RepID=L1J8Q6_GUITC|nr:hypothetical protein GUITHDRAFT_139498 [Guillardia theta CCMP2712]EKX44901.1 hypothetical protein GUITHDRAFT_139498 [Guillardia theta CCMP2712]|eukprot:XP_005831881.1 hypothetical protein GUITHDRAFT_139498 [Guillardia theta CCMP2712]